MSKITKMLGSVRFWYAVVMAVSMYLEASDVLPGAVAKAIELLSILGISDRTVDKFRK